MASASLQYHSYLELSDSPLGHNGGPVDRNGSCLCRECALCEVGDDCVQHVQYLASLIRHD